MRKIYILVLCFAMAGFMMNCGSSNDYASEFKVVKYEVAETPENVAFKKSCDTYLKDATIRLYPNDSIALLSQLGNYSRGTWKNEDDDFKLNIDSVGSMQFIKEDQFDDKDKLEYLVLVGKDAKNNTIKVLLKKSDYYDSKQGDLLSSSSNWWRIKPKKKESPAEIKKRVIAQLDYMIAYFELLEEREYKSFYESHLISPYRLYANGITLDPSYLSSYNQIFYSYDDAAEAYKMLTDGLNSVTAYHRDADRITKGYITALNEIKRFLAVA